MIVGGVAPNMKFRAGKSDTPLRRNPSGTMCGAPDKRSWISLSGKSVQDEHRLLILKRRRTSRTLNGKFCRPCGLSTQPAANRPIGILGSPEATRKRPVLLERRHRRPPPTSIARRATTQWPTAVLLRSVRISFLPAFREVETPMKMGRVSATNFPTVVRYPWPVPI